MTRYETATPTDTKSPQLGALALQQRQLAPVKHGLFVRAESGMRLRSRKVRLLVRKMQLAMPWIAESDIPACRAWGEMEILGAMAFADLVTKGINNDSGEPRRLLSEYRQLRQTQLQYEAQLGMTPAARASLGVDIARGLDLARAMSERGGP